MAKKYFFRADFLLSALIFLLTVAVYIFTLAPTVTLEDSGEFTAVVKVLGIAHPPGYPLYIILGKLFTLIIPWGGVAWRLNLMSAFFGALACAVSYLVMVRLLKNKLIAFCCSLMLAFSEVFWSQSIFAEVYTLNVFFVALLFLILLEWQKKGKDGYLVWFAFLYGLSLTNHTMMSLFAVPFIIFILLVDNDILHKEKAVIKMVLAFTLGISVYLYLPFRSLQQPLINFGQISNLVNLIGHITRRVYNDFSPFAHLYSKLGLIIAFFVLLYQQFFLPTLILSAGGLVYFFKKNYQAAILTIGIFVFNSLGIIFLRKFGFAIGIEYSYKVYYLPCFFVFVIWLALVLQYLYDKISVMLKTRWLLTFTRTVILFFIFTLPISFLFLNYKKNDLSDFWFGYDYTKSVLASLEPNSILYFSYDGSLQGDTEIFNYLYLKMVENFRPDVDVVNELGLFYKDFKADLPKDFSKYTFDQIRGIVLKILSDQKYKDRPIYTNFAVPAGVGNLNLFSVSNGIVYRIYPDLKNAKGARPGIYVPSMRIPPEEFFDDQPTAAGLLGHYYYNLAAFYLTRGELQKSDFYLVKAFGLDNAPFHHEYYRFLDYRNQWLGKTTEKK